MNEEREILNTYKGILDIFQELNSVSDAKDVMKLYIEYLKLQIRLSTNYPNFEENLDGFKYGNCYTYALGLKCPNVFWNKFKSPDVLGMCFDVGLITLGEKLSIKNSSEKMLLDRFYSDCEALKIKVYASDFNDLPSHNGYQIFMFKDRDIGQSYDFHFVRRNYDGTLSHRVGYNDPIHQLCYLFRIPDKYTFVRAFEIVKPVIRERTF